MNMTEADAKNKFIHRDVSWLAFNERVMEEAVDTGNPLLERIKFAAIAMNNLDEFHMVRFADLLRLLELGYNKKDKFGYYAQELYPEIKAKTEEFIKRLYETYHGKLIKELAKHGIYIKKTEEFGPEQKKFVKRYFESTLFPIITPMAVDQGHPFPSLVSGTMAFAVSLSRYEKEYFAVLPIPGNLPRLLKLPSEQDEFNFVLVEEIIRQYLDGVFRGYKIAHSVLFRVLRSGELFVPEDFTADLLRAFEKELKKRPKAGVVCLEVEKSCPKPLLDSLCAGLDFPAEAATFLNADLGLTYLFELYRQVPKPALCYPGFIPVKAEYGNIFEKIQEGDMLLHLPYQSFQPTVDFIRSAAKDENVLAIKITLYRVTEDSAIIQALKEAAKNKKQVTVLVEIKARFEEEKNINWVRELEEAGCHVIYGIANMKIHSKITLIVRKEEGRIRRYVHLSTGNYNEKTALIYTDIGYFTANDDFARDISDVFNVLTGYSVPSRWKRIIASPNDLRQYFFELIDKEIECQKKYKNGLVFAKMNSLEDVPMIEKLYEASAAGVKIRLIVRGICSLIPGAAGLSENIEVRSIVGRFLEHSRVFLFHNNADYRVFVSSADWMSRNLDRRVELLFEIYRDEFKEHLRSVLDFYWKDNVKSRVLLADKSYARAPRDSEKFNAQEYLISHYAS